MYFKGAKRSHPSKIAAATPARKHPAIARHLGAAALPTKVDLVRFTPMVLDQGPTSACTAHAIAGALATTYGALGKPLGFMPSPRQTYAMTRAIERAQTATAGQPLPPLQDGGAELADVVAALSETGVLPMQVAQTPDGRLSDIWADNVNDEPQIQAAEVSSQKLITGPYAVDLAAGDASDVMAAALAANLCVYVAFNCDPAFEQLQAGQVAQAPIDGPSDGGHAVYYSGYVTSPDGSRNFLLCNSWGTGFADEGRVQVSPAFNAAIWEAWIVAVNVQGAA